MTEHKTLNTVIHAAFRRDLGRLDGALGSFPTGSRERAEQIAPTWDNLALQLRKHHQDEETIFWPALRELGADESMVGDLGGEHEHMLTALDTADESMATLRGNPTAENAAAAHASVAQLRRVLEDHLAHEERDLEPFAAEHHKSPQIKAAQVAARKAHRVGVGTFFSWLQDAADADARAGLKRDVPPPALFVISRIAGRDYRRRIASVWA